MGFTTPNFQKVFSLLIFNFCPNMKSFTYVFEKLYLFCHFSILGAFYGILSFNVSDVWCCKIRLKHDELIKLASEVKKGLIISFYGLNLLRLLRGGGV